MFLDWVFSCSTLDGVYENKVVWCLRKQGSVMITLIGNVSLFFYET